MEEMKGLEDYDLCMGFRFHFSLRTLQKGWLLVFLGASVYHQIGLCIINRIEKRAFP
jgi:hypothetical protein